jgi:hypothetical protein
VSAADISRKKKEEKKNPQKPPSPLKHKPPYQTPKIQEAGTNKETPFPSPKHHAGARRCFPNEATTSKEQKRFLGE